MRKLIIGLVCLVGLAVVVDFGAAAYAEYRVSRAIREGAGLNSDPEVTIHGFPFLSHALNGKYDSVELSARGVRADLIGQTTIEATLTGVSVPMSDLIDGNLNMVPVDRVDGRIRIDATELGQAFNIPDLQVSASPADKSDGTGGSGGTGLWTHDGIVLTGTVPVGLEQMKVSVEAEMILEKEQLRIVATEFYFGPGLNFSVPELDVPAVLALFNQSIDTRSLPFGVLPTKVSAVGSQIVIEGTGENVTINFDDLQNS
ncbi:LmeA family phospholipid-binding protein [Antrihabitans sp. YC2-6]|uniref:LmeA family phospholipid-binding protein n=1 Tax=Antrihabitans sp. YC2-6 TaxID=2799498 RepID=UPI0018F5B446|nr:LmeA family phospholipid-binding protein [Antrihabitans sp. YC2-6]MBJ8344531.1 DUF2993 domain-containing protein [Antrihabitans sp. YC2-6]